MMNTGGFLSEFLFDIFKNRLGRKPPCIRSFSRPGEFLVSGYEIKSTGKMRRGQCLSPRTTPALNAIGMYSLIRGCHLGGAQSGGSETPG